MENQQNAQVGCLLAELLSVAAASSCVEFVLCVFVMLSNAAAGGTDLPRSLAVVSLRVVNRHSRSH